MTRVLLVDDEALVRAGMRMILESADDIVVVDEVDDGSRAVEAVERSRPDVVLMDIRMPRLDGLAATAAVRAVPDAPAVVVLTTFDLDDHVFRALQAGAAGFLLKDTPPTGESMLSPTVTRRLIAHFADDPRAERRRAALDRIGTLSAREAEVLVELARGLSNADIGKALFMSEATVKGHVSHMLIKLDCTNRVQLAILAHHAGLAD